MNLPSRPPCAFPDIQTVSLQQGTYAVTLQDNTRLWVPQEPDNADYMRVSTWAQMNNLTLG